MPAESLSSIPSSNNSIAALEAALGTEYPRTRHGNLNEKGVQDLRSDFLAKKGPAYEIVKLRYRDGRDGELTDCHIQRLQDDLETHGNAARYTAFVGMAARVSRYLAYTSDFGEAFRPLVHPWAVKGAYGVSWAYVIGDVAYEGYHLKTAMHADNYDLAMGVTKRAIFQSVASMALPSLTIHSVVKYSNKLFKSHAIFRPVKVWGPTVLGLGMVPFLPVMFDEPSEHVLDYAFGQVWTPKYQQLETHH